MERTIIAVNTAPESENKMHGEEASAYGFQGGLVPGVDVLGYLSHHAVELWGSDWFRGGTLRGVLHRPVYDADSLVIRCAPAPDLGEGLYRAEVAGESGTAIRAEAVLAGPGQAGSSVKIPAIDFLARPERASRPEATVALLEPGTILGSQRATFRFDKAASYLAEISETHPVHTAEGVAHPGWLLRFANWVLSDSVRLGPWIHVASDAQFLRPVLDGEVLDVRAQVRDRFEKKGHEFVDLDVVYLVGDEPVMVVDHRAIWKPRRSSC